MTIREAAKQIIKDIQFTAPELLDTVGLEKVMDTIEDYIFDFMEELEKRDDDEHTVKGNQEQSEYLFKKLGKGE